MIVLIIRRIDSERPPGVSSRRIIASAPSLAARDDASSKYSAAAGPITPSRLTSATKPAGRAVCAAAILPVAPTARITAESPDSIPVTAFHRIIADTLPPRPCSPRSWLRSCVHTRYSISRPARGRNCIKNDWIIASFPMPAVFRAVLGPSERSAAKVPVRCVDIRAIAQQTTNHSSVTVKRSPVKCGHTSVICGSRVPTGVEHQFHPARIVQLSYFRKSCKQIASKLGTDIPICSDDSRNSHLVPGFAGHREQQRRRRVSHQKRTEPPVWTPPNASTAAGTPSRYRRSRLLACFCTCSRSGCAGKLRDIIPPSVTPDVRLIQAEERLTLGNTRSVQVG